jgi:hypothetical protein
MVRTMLPVVAATGVLVAACVGLATVPNLAEAPGAFLALFGLAFVAYAAGLWALSALGDSRAFVVTLVVAGACRVVLLPSLPTLSTDAYRYVWDARVASAGLSPYAHPPVAPEVARLRDATIHPRLNHPTWLTIYPPAAQAFFRTVYAVAPDSVLAMKIALGATEVVGLVLLVALLRTLGLPLVRTAIYAWNPLVLVEVWGSAHLDALAVTAVIGAVLAAVRQRHDLAAVVLALGTLVKVYPAALLPLLVRARGVRVLVPFAIVVALGYAPLLGDGAQALGSLPRYVTEEYFNPGLIRSIVAAPAVPLVGMAAWLGWVVWRSPGAVLVDRLVPLIGGLIVLSPNVFPWYALWLVPFLAVTPSVWWIAFTGTVALAYTFFLYQPWAIPMWARLLEIAPLVLGVVWWLGMRLRHGSAPRNSHAGDIRTASDATIDPAPGADARTRR